MNAPSKHPDETDTSKFKDSLVIGRTSQGIEIRAPLRRLTRYAAVCEFYNLDVLLRTSELLSNFKIIFQERTIYSGRAIVRNLVDSGIATVCELILDEASWLDAELGMVGGTNGKTRADFGQFMDEWQKLYKVSPEFKVAVADLHTFLTDLRLWSDQVEVGHKASSVSGANGNEKELIQKIGRSTVPALTSLFERFEEALRPIDKEFQPVHQAFGRRQLHPLLLCAPFLHRTFYKPLGYAGDYEMVNMIVREPFVGNSLYAKLINYWFLQQAPAEAHRNRIKYLAQQLVRKASEAAERGRPLRVLNLGCGPAHEIQLFLKDHSLADIVQFTLLDFNSETIAHSQTTLEASKKEHLRKTSLMFVKKSVLQILKESAKNAPQAEGEKYDLIYCAGLFDYLTDSVCIRLTETYYNWLAPDGLLITTNVDVSNPRQLTMDYVMDWHLNYRNGAQFAALKPQSAHPDLCSIMSDETGVNIYFEARKPAREYKP